MGTQRVQLKGGLPWLVRWACRAGKRYFCSALAALVGPVQNIFFSRCRLFNSFASWAGSRPGSLVSWYVSHGHRLNMELDFHSLFVLHVHSCTHWLRPRNSPLSPRIWSQIWGHYWSAKIDDISLWPPALGPTLPMHTSRSILTNETLWM